MNENNIKYFSKGFFYGYDRFITYQFKSMKSVKFDDNVKIKYIDKVKHIPKIKRKSNRDKIPYIWIDDGRFIMID